MLTWKDSTEPINWDELSALYRAAPLGNKDPAWLTAVFSNSLFKCFVYEDATLIGAGRALADGADCSYISDVAVLPTHQGMGPGKEIVARLVALSEDHRKIILYAVPGKESFYRKLGFKRMNTAMAKFKDQSSAISQGYIDEA